METLELQKFRSVFKGSILPGSPMSMASFLLCHASMVLLSKLATALPQVSASQGVVTNLWYSTLNYPSALLSTKYEGVRIVSVGLNLAALHKLRGF